ncbi:TPA: hypothetical protein ACYHTB_000522 [Vibrio cholerae]
MQWTEQQKFIFKIWAGRVPQRVLADFVDKSENALSQYASRHKISISFYGKGSQTNAHLRKPREFYEQKRELILELEKNGELVGMSTRQIANKLDVSRNFVETTLKTQKTSQKVQKLNPMRKAQLINSVFAAF